jgi:hypothetical protein
MLYNAMPGSASASAPPHPESMSAEGIALIPLRRVRVGLVAGQGSGGSVGVDLLLPGPAPIASRGLTQFRRPEPHPLHTERAERKY